MASKFFISGQMEAITGNLPGEPLEVDFTQTDDDCVLVGIGLRAGGDDLTTMHLKYAKITDEGKLDRDNTFTVKKGSAPTHALEVIVETLEKQEVIVGCAVRGHSDGIWGLQIHCRDLDPTTGKLGTKIKTYKTGHEPDVTEVDLMPETKIDVTLLRGLGLLFRSNGIQKMRHYYGVVELRKPDSGESDNQPDQYKR